MPQPLSKVRSDGELYFSAGCLYKSAFAADVAYIIALWAHIEGNIATILSRMLRADIAVGTAMYLALTGSEGKRAALRAAAREALPEWQAILLEAIFKATKAARDQRNRFSHHVWGRCEGVNAILLTHPKTIVNVNISHRQAEENVTGSGRILRPKSIDRSQIDVYRKKDFEEAVGRSTMANHMVSLFYATFGVAPAGPREQLLGYEDIQRALVGLTTNCSAETLSLLVRRS